MSATHTTRRAPGFFRSGAASAAAVFLFAALCAHLSAGEERNLESERALERKCIDCHDDPALHGSRPDGRLRSVFLDPERYKKSIHTEKDLTCVSCHPNAREDYHCREGVEILSCGACHDHEDELADFKKSRHGRHLDNKAENAADCQHCHTNHYTMKKDDPEASIHPAKIRATCGACHAMEARLTGGASWPSGSRFAAHGKADLSENYSIDDCSRCHFGPDAHKARKPEEIDRCAACHRRGDDGASRPVLGPVHLDDTGFDGFALSSLRALGGILAVIAPLLLLGFVAALRVKLFAAPGKKKEAAPDA